MGEIFDSMYEAILAGPQKSKVYNGTPHNINIYFEVGVYDEKLRKHVFHLPDATKKPDISIPTDGMLSAKIKTVFSDYVEGIPVYKKKISGCDPLPEGYDVYVVSALFAYAARKCGMDTSKLYTVADPVYSKDGRTILGCLGICPAF
jgi:hypothetical protein